MYQFYIFLSILSSAASFCFIFYRLPVSLTVGYIIWLFSVAAFIFIYGTRLYCRRIVIKTKFGTSYKYNLSAFISARNSQQGKKAYDLEEYYMRAEKAQKLQCLNPK